MGKSGDLGMALGTLPRDPPHRISHGTSPFRLRLCKGLRRPLGDGGYSCSCNLGLSLWGIRPGTSRPVAGAAAWTALPLIASNPSNTKRVTSVRPLSLVPLFLLVNVKIVR